MAKEKGSSRYAAYVRQIDSGGSLGGSPTPKDTGEEDKDKRKVAPGAGCEGRNVVCMLQKELFVREGTTKDNTAVFRVFRGGPCDARDVIRWGTVDGVGTAVHGHHYRKSSGSVVFEAGQTMASFGVEIVDDDKWEPVRDFVVVLEEVVEGDCAIGALDHTVCIIADDDIYPEKVPRDPSLNPLKQSERTLPSCSRSEAFLTSDETPDWKLVWGYIKERWRKTWPWSYWGAVWACYRAFYGVAMSFVIVVYIDQVLVVPTEENAAGAAARVTLAIVLGVGVLFAKLVNAKTETWIIDNRKGALTRKQLREWMVVQLLWADESRLSLMRASNYLNAATSEVDAAADCYETIFPMIEDACRFVLNFFMICYLVPIAAPIILLLIPVAAFVQWYRAPVTTELLVKRQQCERQWVSTLSDVIENTPAFRGLAAAGNVAQTFSAESQCFSRAHLDALHYNTRTRQLVDAFCAVILCGLLILAAVLTNTGVATPGAIVGLITAFQSSSDNVLAILRCVLFLKFCSERLRNVCRILNYPTDAHSLADMEVNQGEVAGMWKKTRQQAFELVQELPPRSGPAVLVPGDAQLRSFEKEEHDEDGYPKFVGQWANHICVRQHAHRCNTRRSLNHSLASHGQHSQTLIDKVVVMSLEAEDPNDSEGGISWNARLGGVILIKGAKSSDLSTLLQIMSGAKAVQHKANIYAPEFLYYMYVSEVPSLLEGSILHNLLCAVSKRRRVREPTHEEAWRVAEMCGLSSEFIRSPDSFSVGKAGRNLSMSDRQSVCIARALLCDPDVLVMHYPTELMERQKEVMVLQLFSDFVSKGGIWAILDGPQEAYRGHGDKGGKTPLDYVKGTGVRTVIFSHQRPGRMVESIVTSTLNLETMDCEQKSSSFSDGSFIKGVSESPTGAPPNARRSHRLSEMGLSLLEGLNRLQNTPGSPPRAVTPVKRPESPTQHLKRRLSRSDLLKLIEHRHSDVPDSANSSPMAALTLPPQSIEDQDKEDKQNLG